MATDKQVEAALAIMDEPMSMHVSRASRMKAALEAAEAAAWEAIESAPKDGRWFLAGETTTYDLVGGHTFHACTARFEYPSDDAPEIMRANGYDAGPTWPTHWRHLPQPPKETT